MRGKKIVILNSVRKKNNKITGISKYLLIITLKANALNSPKMKAD
jgi:hypothetical protein